MFAHHRIHTRGSWNKETIPLTLIGEKHRAGVLLGHPHDVMNLYFLDEKPLICEVGTLSRLIVVNAACHGFCHAAITG